MGTRIRVVLESIDYANSEPGDNIYAYDSEKHLYPCQYPHICPSKDKIAIDEVVKALDTIACFFMNNRENMIIYDLKKRDNDLMPAKEMTVKEIEEELGYKIKIIKEG